MEARETILKSLLEHTAGDHYCEVATKSGRGFKSFYLSKNDYDKLLFILDNHKNVYINNTVQKASLSKRPTAENCLYTNIIFFDLEHKESHKQDKAITLDDAKELLNRFFNKYSFMQKYVRYGIFTGRGVQLLVYLESKKNKKQYDVICSIFKKHFSDEVIDSTSFSFNRLMRLPFSQRTFSDNKIHNVSVIYYNENSVKMSDVAIYSLYKHESKYNNDIVNEIKKVARFEDFVSYERKGSKYSLLLCPFHDERHPSAAVYHNSDFEVLVDFHDGETYDIISFYMKKENVDFSTAMRELAEKYNISYNDNVKSKSNNAKSNVDKNTDEVYYDVLDARVIIRDNMFFVSRGGKTALVSNYFQVYRAGNKYYIETYVKNKKQKTILLDQEDFNYNNVKKVCDFYNARLGHYVYQYILENMREIKTYNVTYNEDEKVYITKYNAHLYKNNAVITNEQFLRYLDYNIDEEYLSKIKMMLQENSLLTKLIVFSLSSLIGNSAVLVLRGKSGAGKTTVVNFLSSFFSSIRISGVGTTAAGFRELINNFDRFTVTLDEINHIHDAVFEHIAFLTDDMMRVHSSSKREAKVAERKNIIVLCTAEKGFDIKNHKTAGILRRVYNVEIEDFTDITKIFELKDFFSPRTGLAPLVFEYIKKNNLEEKYVKEYIYSDYKYVNKMIAMCYILQDMFNVDLTSTINDLYDFGSEKVIDNAFENDIIQEFFDFIEENSKNFYSITNKTVQKVMGMYEYSPDKTGLTEEELDVIDETMLDKTAIALWVTSKTISDFVKQSKKIMRKHFLKKLKEAGYIDSTEPTKKKFSYDSIARWAFRIDLTKDRPDNDNHDNNEYDNKNIPF